MPVAQYRIREPILATQWRENESDLLGFPDLRRDRYTVADGALVIDNVGYAPCLVRTGQYLLRGITGVYFGLEEAEFERIYTDYDSNHLS